MYFKRPSFRRGGSTGIGQLSSRVKARDGFMGMNFGVGQGDNTGYQKYLETMRANKSSGQPSGLAQLILGPRYTDPTYVSPFLKPDSPFFSNRTGFEFMNPGVNQNGPATFMTNKGPTQTVEDIKITSNADELPNMTGDPAQFTGEDKLTDFEALKKKSTSTGDSIATGDSIGIDESLGELSMKDSIEGEVGILKELLKNTGMSKGEKALLLAKAVGTPGTLKDKLDVGANEALKYKTEERKQDKAIILTAYKNYKAAELAGGKLDDNEKKVKSYVALKRQAGDKRPQQELELEAIEIVYKPRSIAPADANCRDRCQQSLEHRVEQQE